MLGEHYLPDYTVPTMTFGGGRIIFFMGLDILDISDLDWDVIKAPLGVGPVVFFMKSQSVHNKASSQAVETKKSGKIRRDPGYLRSGLIWI